MTTIRPSPTLLLTPESPHAGAVASSARSRTSLLSYPRPLVETTLERVLTSATFRRSQRHRRFLRHIVRAALDEEHEQLKEVIIGLEIFGRALATYDPRSDPIVRVEAGRLREKLLRFYADEGDDEPFEISIPVGAYLPRFSPRPSGSARAAARRSIAILPFRNLSGHVDDNTFAIGLADQLIDTLGRVPVLKVVARVSALEAGVRELPVKSVSKLLGVEHVVEGSVQRSGARIRCIARFSTARDGLQIWSQRFEEPDAQAADLFAFQDRIADAVFDAVTTSLQPARAGRPLPEAPSKPPSPANTEARFLFERARYLNQQGSIDAYRQAIDLLERAIVVDPGFAQAHSQLGVSRAMLGPYVFAPSFPNFAKVREAALRALELDPLDGEARALLANHAYRFERDWPRAEREFREALRLIPSSTLIHNYFSWALMFNGHTAEASQHARTALTLDPLNIALRAHNARLYSYARDYETAIAELHAVLALDRQHLYARLVLGIIHLSMGRHDVAMPYFEQIARENPSHTAAHLHMICVWGLRGEIELGKRKLAAFLDDFRDADYSPFYIALAQACLGEHDATLASLEETARVQDNLMVSIPYHALLDGFRDDPAYLAFLERQGLRLPP